MKLAIVIPALNESAQIVAHLQALQPLRGPQCELILADGGSSDATAELAAPLVDKLVHAPRGRARQMNAGAAAASADLLLFLHADTRLPERAPEALRRHARQVPGVHFWGRFDVIIEGRPLMLKAIAALMNRRSRLTGIATGDQAIFIARHTFDAVGGYPDQPLMEDIEISRRLKRLMRPLCLREHVRTSGRRWEQRGLWRTVLQMWSLRLRYWLGTSPETLARAYR